MWSSLKPVTLHGISLFTPWVKLSTGSVLAEMTQLHKFVTTLTSFTQLEIGGEEAPL